MYYKGIFLSNNLKEYEKDLTYLKCMNDLLWCVSQNEYFSLSSRKHLLAECIKNQYNNVAKIPELLETISLHINDENREILSNFIVTTEQAIDSYLQSYGMVSFDHTRDQMLIIINAYNVLARKIYKDMIIFRHILPDYITIDLSLSTNTKQ